MIDRRLPTPENEIRRQEYAELVKGLKSQEDPITWRTLIVDLRHILGSDIPEKSPPPLERMEGARQLISRLTARTYLAELHNEILWGCFGEYGQKNILPKKEDIKPLDYLIISGRHKSQELLWKVAEKLKSGNKSVAVINPIGHYNDFQTRMIVPDMLVRPVRHAIFLSSTQNEDGGEVSVLNLALRALRNPNFAYMIDNVHVVVPMFGGSRGHKAGQNKVIGFEALETIYHAKDLIETIDDIKESINGPHKYEVYRHVRTRKPDLKFPHVDFSTIDIHNNNLPGKKFRERRYGFKSLSPAPEFASKCLSVLEETPFARLPKKIVVCDEGSICRTEKLAEEILRQGECEIEIVYIDKTRIRAGEVANSSIARVATWRKNEEGIIVKQNHEGTNLDASEACVLIFNDDMIDTGGTAGKDIKLVKSFLTNAKFTVFIATHPIFSQGIGEALSKMAGVDVFMVGNTLSNSRFAGYKNIVYVDLGLAIARSLQS